MLAQPTVCCPFLVFVFARFWCSLEPVMIRQTMSACCVNVWHIQSLTIAHNCMKVPLVRMCAAQMFMKKELKEVEGLNLKQGSCSQPHNRIAFC
jgi:hypothetical protein